MKNTLIFCLLLILTPITLYAQSKLIVNIKDCNFENRFDYLEEFKLFKDDSLVKIVNPKYESKQVLKKLEYGKYTIEYTSIFKKTERVQIELTEKKRYEIDICTNYFNHKLESYIPFIDRLRNEEQYLIEITSSGCFHMTRELIFIKKRNNQFYISSKEKEVLLNKEGIETIRKFEIELNYINTSGCTTVDIYTLKYKDHIVSVSDGSCQWNGFSKINSLLY